MNNLITLLTIAGFAFVMNGYLSTTYPDLKTCQHNMIQSIRLGTYSHKGLGPYKDQWNDKDRGCFQTSDTKK